MSNHPSESGKRIVSKGQYVRGVSKKAAIGLGSSSLAIVIALFIVSAIGLTFASVTSMPNVGQAVSLFGGAILCCYAATRLKQVAEKGIEEAQKIDPGIPLTRANLGHLPISESLVRASEPPQEQQSVLLRAAASNNETPPEQLLRASTPEENT
jgi:hypothetical protein